MRPEDAARTPAAELGDAPSERRARLGFGLGFHRVGISPYSTSFLNDIDALELVAFRALMFQWQNATAWRPLALVRFADLTTILDLMRIRNLQNSQGFGRCRHLALD